MGRSAPYGSLTPATERVRDRTQVVSRAMGLRLPSAPKSAWVVIGVGLAGSAVLVPLALERGQLSAAEHARIVANAEARAAVTAAEEAATPPSEIPPEPLPLPRPAVEPMRVLYAGDSITVGAFAMTRDENFRNRTTTALSTGGEIEPVRIGDSGLTTSEVLPEVAGAGNVDLALVELGTNDVLKSTPEEFREDYPAFLDAVRAESPDAVLVCAGVWGEATLKVRQMDSTVETECEERGGRFVSLLDLYADEANRGPAGTVRPLDGEVLDDFHPNSAGHAAIADALLGQLAY